MELADFSGLLGENGVLWAKSIEVNVATVKVDFEPVENLSSETFAGSADNLLDDSDGDETSGLAEAAFRSERMMKKILTDATEGHKSVEIAWLEKRDPAESGLWMRKLEPSNCANFKASNRRPETTPRVLEGAPQQPPQLIHCDQERGVKRLPPIQLDGRRHHATPNATPTGLHAT